VPDFRGGRSAIIDIGSDTGGGLDGVIADDANRLDEDGEVTSGNVVGVVPVDHAPGPMNDALGTSFDTGGPYTVGV